MHLHSQVAGPSTMGWAAVEMIVAMVSPVSVSTRMTSTERSITPFALMPMIVRPSSRRCRLLAATVGVRPRFLQGPATGDRCWTHRFTPSAELPLAEPTRQGARAAWASTATEVRVSRSVSR